MFEIHFEPGQVEGRPLFGDAKLAPHAREDLGGLQAVLQPGNHAGGGIAERVGQPGDRIEGEASRAKAKALKRLRVLNLRRPGAEGVEHALH